MFVARFKFWSNTLTEFHEQASLVAKIATSYTNLIDSYVQLWMRATSTSKESVVIPGKAVRYISMKETSYINM